MSPRRTPSRRRLVKIMGRSLPRARRSHFRFGLRPRARAAGTCHSSTLFPSGSRKEPNRPYGCSSTSPTMRPPPRATCRSAPSRSSTTRLIMNGCFDGLKCRVARGKTLQTVTAPSGMSAGRKRTNAFDSSFIPRCFEYHFTSLLGWEDLKKMPPTPRTFDTGTPIPLLRKLGREHVELLDGGRLRQEVGRLRHERGGNLPRKVRLAACIVGEGIENAERGWPEADREPGRRGRLPLYDGKPATEKALDLLLLSGFRLQSNQQG